MEKNQDDSDLLAKWLNNELPKEDQVRLEKDGQLDDLKAVVGDIDSWSLPPMDVAQGLTALQSKKQQSGSDAKTFPLASWWRVAAAVALFILGYFGWDSIYTHEVTLYAGIGQQKEIELPDGSLVRLDANSSLTYSKRWGDDRKVSIEGQAFLDIEKGGSFIVNTNKGSVEVLGTQFNVLSTESQFAVDCYEGIVQVKSQGIEERLAVGQGVQLTNGVFIRQELTQETPDWTRGYSAYDQAKLSLVIADLKKYYKVEMDLPEKYSELEFTGQFPHDNLTAALRSVLATMEINYTVDSNGKVDFY